MLKLSHTIEQIKNSKTITPAIVLSIILALSACGENKKQPDEKIKTTNISQFEDIMQLKIYELKKQWFPKEETLKLLGKIVNKKDFEWNIPLTENISQLSKYNFPIEIIEEFVLSQTDRSIKTNIIWNFSLSKKTLLKLSENNWIAKTFRLDIIHAIASQENCPLEVFKLIEQFDLYKRHEYTWFNNWDVYSKIAAIDNPNCPIKIKENLLKQLLKINNDDINYILVASDLEIVHKAMINSNIHNSFILLLLENPTISHNMLSKIFEKFSKNYDSQFSWFDIITDTLLHPNCPESLLIKASKKTELLPYVLRAPNCTTKIFEKYSKSKDLSLKVIIVENPNCPNEIADKLFEEIYNSYDKLSIEDKEILARNPKTPKKILEILAKERWEYTLYISKIAENKLQRL